VRGEAAELDDRRDDNERFCQLPNRARQRSWSEPVAEAARRDPASYQSAEGTLNPTLWQLELLITVVRTGSNRAAAEALGVPLQNVKNNLTRMYRRIGASNRDHAVYLVWPIIKDTALLPWEVD